MHKTIHNLLAVHLNKEFPHYVPLADPQYLHTLKNNSFNFYVHDGHIILHRLGSSYRKWTIPLADPNCFEITIKLIKENDT